ncbi:hypothetical protein, partial [Pseudomonas sp.]|uniref:hypothetical protein n=1 Tax=Pseudomonas sp. TaxID=306 RepID=UPI00257CCAE2
KRQRELGCGYTLYGWDGDNLAWESSPPQDEGEIPVPTGQLRARCAGAAQGTDSPVASAGLAWTKLC